MDAECLWAVDGECVWTENIHGQGMLVGGEPLWTANSLDGECLWMENVDGECSWTESVCHKDGKYLWTRTYERLIIMEGEPWRTIRDGECL